MTVTRRIRSPGRARNKPLKPLRRECRVFRGTCGDYARVLYFILHARLRVHWAPGIPLRPPGRNGSTTRAHRAAGMRSCVRRHCEERLVRRSSTSEGGSDEAIHSFVLALWIASQSLSSGAHSRDPLARNDGLQPIVVPANAGTHNHRLSPVNKGIDRRVPS
jgi:hypothetical protein